MLGEPENQFSLTRVAPGRRRARNQFLINISIAAAIIWAALFAVSAVHASPLKGPKRMVNGQTVDLTPLFHWWTNHSGMRPLTAWVHVTGRIVDTNGLNWVVQASVESSGREQKEGKPSTGGQKRILLRTPPQSDRAQFEQLLAQLKPLKDERAKVAAAEAKAKNQAKTSKTTSHTTRGRLRAQARAQQAQQTQAQDQDQLDQLDSQIKPLEAKLATYPSSDHYLVDCFALDTGQDQRDLPLYDHGTSWQ